MAKNNAADKETPTTVKEKSKKTSKDENFAPPNLDYDNLLKTILHRHFWHSLKIFLPALHADADTAQQPKFLEQELLKITLDLKGHPNRTDLLVEIPMKNGEKKCILAHLELQGTGGGDMPTRMNKYRAMIYLRHEIEPVAIAVLIAPRPKSEARSYISQQYSTRVVYEYENVDVAALDDADLLADDNPVALILYAAKRAQKSKGDEAKKFRYLRDISNIWAERGWSNDEKRIIMLAIEYLMNLKDPVYENLMVEHFESLEKRGKVMYTSLAERVYGARGREEGRKEGRKEGWKKGLEQGVAKGLEQGVAKGRKQGQEEGRIEIAKRLLSLGAEPDFVVTASGLSPEAVEALREN